MFELIESCNQNAVIKVVGIGGGGSNAIQHMLSGNIEGVEFICANTDHQALARSSSKNILQLGRTGLGAGSRPEAAHTHLQNSIATTRVQNQDLGQLVRVR